MYDPPTAESQVTPRLSGVDNSEHVPSLGFCVRGFSSAPAGWFWLGLSPEDDTKMLVGAA